MRSVGDVELTGARVLVAGATGVLGQALSRALAESGARVALAGRTPDRLAALAEELAAPSVVFDVLDVVGTRAAVGTAADALDGLDALVCTVGVAAFGPAETLDDAVAEQLFAVNVLGPMALVNAALPRFDDGGAVAVLSAIVADYPTADMAAYSATKAALSAYLAAVRREQRKRGVTVLDVRPQHLETGFSDRALAGSPPSMPAAADIGDVVATTLRGLTEGKREIAYDLKARELVLR